MQPTSIAPLLEEHLRTLASEASAVPFGRESLLDAVTKTFPELDPETAADTVVRLTLALTGSTLNTLANRLGDMSQAKVKMRVGADERVARSEVNFVLDDLAGTGTTEAAPEDPLPALFLLASVSLGEFGEEWPTFFEAVRGVLRTEMDEQNLNARASSAMANFLHTAATSGDLLALTADVDSVYANDEKFFDRTRRLSAFVHADALKRYGFDDGPLDDSTVVSIAERIPESDSTWSGNDELAVLVHEALAAIYGHHVEDEGLGYEALAAVLFVDSCVRNDLDFRDEFDALLLLTPTGE
jgi:hypothetical protein